MAEDDNPYGVMRDILATLGSLNKSKPEGLGLTKEKPSWGGIDPVAEEEARYRLEGKMPPPRAGLSAVLPPAGSTAPESMAPANEEVMPTGRGRSRRSSLQQLTGAKQGIPLSQFGVGSQIKMQNKLFGSKIKGKAPLGATYDEY